MAIWSPPDSLEEMLEAQQPPGSTSVGDAFIATPRLDADNPSGEAREGDDAGKINCNGRAVKIGVASFLGLF